VSLVELLNVALDFLGRHCIIFIRALLTEIVPLLQGKIEWVVVVVIVEARAPPKLTAGASMWSGA
jgi:hypothetical protein